MRAWKLSIAGIITKNIPANNASIWKLARVCNERCISVKSSNQECWKLGMFYLSESLVARGSMAFEHILALWLLSLLALCGMECIGKWSSLSTTVRSDSKKPTYMYRVFKV